MILWSMMDDLMMHDMLWFLFEPILWCIHGCVDAWVEFAFFHFPFFLYFNLRARKTRLEARRIKLWG